MKVIASAPTRVDLAGGTLDLWPIHQLLDHKATVNIGITLPAEVTVELADGPQFQFTSEDQNLTWSGTLALAGQSSLPLVGRVLQAIWNESLPALKIKTKAKSPAGAGLGGSSCLAVTIAGALQKARAILTKADFSLNERAIVGLCGDVEAHLIHAPTGTQDYWGAVRGGINIMRFHPGNTDVKTLAASACSGLEEKLIVCYSGQSRASAINNWEIFKRLFDGDKALLARFETIGRLAEECAGAILKGDVSTALDASHREWRERVALWPNIQTDQTKKLDAAGRVAGAEFSRVCGAGGGGVMAFFGAPAKRSEIANALTKAGGQVLDATIARSGLTIT